jgi:hypothetical protein
VQGRQGVLDDGGQVRPELRHLCARLLARSGWPPTKDLADQEPDATRGFV